MNWWVDDQRMPVAVGVAGRKSYFVYRLTVASKKLCTSICYNTKNNNKRKKERERR